MKYKILQLNKDHHDLLFMMFDDVDNVDINNYHVVYEGEYPKEVNDKNINDALNHLYMKFNSILPDTYNGHSLSISDIIEINGHHYYIDSFDFKKVD